MQPNGQTPSPRLSELLRAVADGLNNVHLLLRALVSDDHPAIVGHLDTTEVLTKGPQVAGALQSIAERLDSQEEE